MVNSTETEGPVVTRFAPSPTGFLHIGGARTALFNWLYARGRDGTFLLRIEDTDRARSSDEATDAIFAGLRWLGLDWDGDAVSQASRAERHAEIAHMMVARGAAYKCYATQDEIETFRETARAEGRSTLYRSPWRDADPATHPDAPFAIRIKAPLSGETIIRDRVQGDVTIDNAQLDDMICLRSDGSPTYMLAVVVDDHDMGVSHVIRGDDHLNNTARQMMIYAAMDWRMPTFAHIPLIHGEDGKKLSKRHGALGVAEYAAMGYPASALRNYLARLGWSHGDDEVFTTEQARDWFDLDGIGKAPARLDFKKLGHISGQHMAVLDDAAIVTGIRDWQSAAGHPQMDQQTEDALRPALPLVKSGARTFPDLLEKAHFALTRRPIRPEPKAAKQLSTEGLALLAELTPHLQTASWERDTLEAAATKLAEDHGMGLGKLAGPLRAALAGRAATPSVFDMMIVLGRDETVARVQDAIETGPQMP